MLKLTSLMKIHLLRDGQAFGPFSVDSIREMVKLGVVFESDLARYEGASEWIVLNKLRDFNAPLLSGISSAAFDDSLDRTPVEPGKPQPSIALATGAALAMAGLGGWIWTRIAIAADREFRVIALVIASCCAGAVLYCSIGGRGLRFQLVACAATLAGIVIGKCGVAWHLARLSRAAEGVASGVGWWANMPDLLGEVFTRHLPHIF